MYENTTPEALMKTCGIKNAVQTSVTKRYFFPHTNKKDKKAGKRGCVSKKASLFYHACFAVGWRAEYTIFSEEGTGIEVTQRLTVP